MSTCRTISSTRGPRTVVLILTLLSSYRSMLTTCSHTRNSNQASTREVVLNPHRSNCESASCRLSRWNHVYVWVSVLVTSQCKTNIFSCLQKSKHSTRRTKKAMWKSSFCFLLTCHCSDSRSQSASSTEAVEFNLLQKLSILSTAYHQSCYWQMWQEFPWQVHFIFQLTVIWFYWIFKYYTLDKSRYDGMIWVKTQAARWFDMDALPK